MDPRFNGLSVLLYDPYPRITEGADPPSTVIRDALKAYQAGEAEAPVVVSLVSGSALSCGVGPTTFDWKEGQSNTNRLQRATRHSTFDMDVESRRFELLKLDFTEKALRRWMLAFSDPTCLSAADRSQNGPRPPIKPILPYLEVRISSFAAKSSERDSWTSFLASLVCLAYGDIYAIGGISLSQREQNSFWGSSRAQC
jgi:hypothetical protein